MYPSGSLSRRASASSRLIPAGTYPTSGSCAEVWSVTMSASKPRRRSSGTTSAALPRTPTLSAPASPLGFKASGGRVVEVNGTLVEVPGLEAPLDPRVVHLDAQGDALVHGHRERLRAAHAAEPGGERDRSGQRSAEPSARDLGEALVGALHDPLAPDVDPGACGHLPVHREAERLEPPEFVPVGPIWHEIGVGDEDTRRPLVGSEAHRPACPTARAASRRPRGLAATHTIASNASHERAARPVPP